VEKSFEQDQSIKQNKGGAFKSSDVAENPWARGRVV